jgi:hypothetical protein
MSPAVNPPTDQYLRTTIKQLQSDVAKLQQQQQTGIVDSKGVQRILIGRQSDGTYGIVAFDASGNRRIDLGQLSNGDYGLASYSLANDGTFVEVLPIVVAPEVAALETTAATSYGDLATVGPVCTVTVGASGRVNVIGGSYIGLPGEASANPVAAIGLFVDGVQNPTRSLASLQMSTGTSATGVAGTTFGQVLITGLTPGAHTFKLQYKTSGLTGGNTVTFGFRTLSVQPL